MYIRKSQEDKADEFEAYCDSGSSYNRQDMYMSAW